MKYLITKRGRVIIGNVGHWELKKAVSDDKIVGAGYVRFKNGKFECYGKSYTFDIESRSFDADIIENILRK